MSTKELKLFQEILRRQHEEVKTSKKAAKKLLTDLGLLNPTGNVKQPAKPGQK